MGGRVSRNELEELVVRERSRMSVKVEDDFVEKKEVKKVNAVIIDKRYIERNK